MLGVPTRDRVSERREATRQEILEAAWAVARDQGVAQLTLREVAARVGMRPPSLYSHFASKAAIYDAMFRQGWEELVVRCKALQERLPDPPRERLTAVATVFFDFSVEDPARFTLLNQRTLRDFEPSPAAYAPAVAAVEQLRQMMSTIGVEDDRHVDLYTALLGGLVNAQLANDPGGDRYRVLLRSAIDMFADHVGLPR